jgi:hypothetical protein
MKEAITMELRTLQVSASPDYREWAQSDPRSRPQETPGQSSKPRTSEEEHRDNQTSPREKREEREDEGE